MFQIFDDLRSDAARFEQVKRLARLEQRGL